MKLEVKDENDPDVKPYVHNKEIVPIVIKGNDTLNTILGKMHVLL